MRTLLIGFCLALLATSASAQNENKLPVHISINTDDPIGRRLAFFVRDEIGKSGTFAEVDDDFGRGFKVEIVTIDPYSDGKQTFYSLVILIANDEGFDYYLSSYVGSCGDDKPRNCAQSIMGYLGENVEFIRQAVSKQKRTDFK